MARRNIAPDAPGITTWDGADAALGRIRELDSVIAGREAEKADELRAIQETYDREIIARRDESAALAKALQEFAEIHRADFGRAQSRALNHGVIGWRRGQPTLATLKKWTWKKVQAAVEASAWVGGLIRVKREIDKDAIKAALDAGRLSADMARALGLEIIQEERFYIETKAADTIHPEVQP